MASDYISRSRAAEEADDIGSNESVNPTLGDVIAARFRRRDLLKGVLAVTAISATVSPLALSAGTAQAQTGTPGFTFKEVEAGIDERHHIADGYDADILIRWGDPIFADAPEFDPRAQTADKQRRQFGYNNDFLGYFPINGSNRGLLGVNHEYTAEELMFPGLGKQDEQSAQDPNDPKKKIDVSHAKTTEEIVAIEMAGQGGSVIEIERRNGKWSVVRNSKYSRRITAETEMEITGPAAGHARMKTKADPAGRKVLGMFNNCAGGVTPWGTWVTCEENINHYFWGKLEDSHPEARAFKRYGVPGNRYAWGKWHDRFDILKEPNEANRFGWVVEIDPYDPNSVPKKRTALGRFKHEGAAGITNKDGRYVIYSGDDERFDYVYKFISRGTVNPNDRAANMDLLAEGTLYVARYNADGTGEWLPLIHGQGPLTEANGFKDQGELLIYARLAADALGATKMDRPEDIDVNPKTNKVYAMLTNNNRRTEKTVDAVNPRADNRFGHIVEMTPDNLDHGSTKFTWEILLKCGDPAVAEVGATFSSATSKDGWFGMPDNCAFDSQGRMWITTDGNSGVTTKRNDGVWAVETEGPMRGTSKHFFRCPVGAEMCGPVFTPDDETMFVAVQHPGEDGEEWPAFNRPSTFDDPSTRWPDFKEGIPPRPSIVAITKRGGGKIGT